METRQILYDAGSELLIALESFKKAEDQATFVETIIIRKITAAITAALLDCESLVFAIDSDRSQS